MKPEQPSASQYLKYVVAGSLITLPLLFLAAPALQAIGGDLLTGLMSFLVGWNTHKVGKIILGA